jgi:hypothetical protein
MDGGCLPATIASCPYILDVPILGLALQKRSAQGTASDKLSGASGSGT